MIIVDEKSLKIFIKSSQKHIANVEKIMERNNCSVTGGELATEINRFEESIQKFIQKNNLGK